MRAYFWSHDMLKSICRGVQSTHAAVEMSILPADQRAIFEDWVKNHKTIIFLKGGNCALLKRGFAVLEQAAGDLGLPCAVFYEDEATLNGAITAFSVVVPEYIYDKTDPQEWKELFFNATKTYGSTLEAAEFGEGYSAADRIRLLMDAPLAD